ncbi:hypothetical protein L0F63_006091 [Massospora cicadina]|nr:hypothetical protein L0F63_006091 [Massospora cicadina]
MHLLRKPASSNPTIQPTIVRAPEHLSHGQQLLVHLHSRRWSIIQSDGCPACVVDCEPGKGLARIFNAEGALIARVEKRRILSSTYPINLVIGRGAETISKATMSCRSKGAPGALSSFQIKIRERATGSVTLYRWLCISPKEWWLAKCERGEPLDLRTVNTVGQFLSVGPNSGILSFYQLTCPARASIFTLAIAYLKCSHINLLDALSLTDRNVNLI